MARQNPFSPQNYGPAMQRAVKNTKVFGMPQPKKMSKDQVLRRKRSRVSNAAGKLMGGLYSK